MSAATVRLVGNTIDPVGRLSYSNLSVGISCTASTLTAISNLIGGGYSAGRMILSTTDPDCMDPKNFKNNYFWFDRPDVLLSSDVVLTVATNPTVGAADANGNIYGEHTSCFDPADTPPTFRLGAGSPCANRGLAGTRLDGSGLSLDVESKPRQLGSAVDIGCSERE